MVALFWQTGQGGMWKVPQEAPVGCLCISKMWLFNFFLVKRTLKQELQGKEESVKKDQGEFDHHALPPCETAGLRAEPSLLQKGYPRTDGPFD